MIEYMQYIIMIHNVLYTISCVHLFSVDVWKKELQMTCKSLESRGIDSIDGWGEASLRSNASCLRSHHMLNIYWIRKSWSHSAMLQFCWSYTAKSELLTVCCWPSTNRNCHAVKSCSILQPKEAKLEAHEVQHVQHVQHVQPLQPA